MNIRRLLTLIAICCLSLAGLVGMSTTAAARSISCGSRSKHYDVRDGSIGIRVGNINIHVEVCTDGDTITTSNMTISNDETAPGTTAGFSVGTGSPYRTSFVGGGFSGGSFGWTSEGSLKDCAVKFLPFCSSTERFIVHAHVTMYNQLIIRKLSKYDLIIHGRVFHWSWSHRCTNSVCRVRLS